jgi:N-acyl-D-aspartate/D-glutamate deacylase
MAAVLALSLCVGTGAQAQYDLLIQGARLLDGTGNPWRTANIAITGDRIAAVGLLPGATAGRVINGTGLFVAPGFIDTHSHAAGGLASPGLSHGRPLLAQGITTVVVNPDGGGPADLVAQRAALLEHGLGVNVAQFVPHGAVRQAVIGMDDRAPTDAELDEMKALVRRGMEAGAFGLSSGLYYAPGSYSETPEVIALAKVAAAYEGVYQSHIRDEADYNVGVVAAVDEVIRIAREGELTGIVTHIKALGPRVWGYAEALVRRVEAARAEGVSVFADQYPYEASGTSVGGALIPRWAQAGGRDALRERLGDRDERARMRAGVLENLDRRGGAHRLQIGRHAPDPSIEGKTLQDVADQRGVHPADLALQLVEAGGATLVSFNMDEADIRTLMRQSWTMTASDGGLTEMGRGVPHPRYYGTFPRKIRRYVRDQEVLALEDAVRTMTSLPASVFGMSDRGVLREGAFADIVVFDLERLADHATYSDPHQLAGGVVYLLVNGRLAIDDGEFDDDLHGRVLQRR